MNWMMTSYIVSALGYIVSLSSGRDRARQGAFFALVTGLVLSIAAIVKRSLLAGHAPCATLYDVLLLLTAVVVLLSAAVEYRLKIKIAGLLAGISAVALLACASTLNADLQPLVPVLRSKFLVVHVASYIAGYAACTVAFAMSAVYLCAGRRKVFEQATAKAERLMHIFVLAAFPFLTLGMSLGMVWADNAWGRYWGWDPKESWSLIAWLIYGFYVHMHLLRGWRGRRTAYLSLAGFCAILFTMFGVNLLAGLHSYG